MIRNSSGYLIISEACFTKAAGVDVKLNIGEGLFHCYPAVAPLFPEAKQAMNDICAFIKTHIDN